MCTSRSDRKIVTCCHAPAGASSGRAGPACITRPSAGDSTRLGSADDPRRGSRKNRPMATGRTSSAAATSRRSPEHDAARAGTAAMATKGTAAASMLTNIRTSGPATRAMRPGAGVECFSLVAESVCGTGARRAARPRTPLPAPSVDRRRRSPAGLGSVPITRARGATESARPRADPGSSRAGRLHREPQSFVQSARRLVRPPHLERRRPRAGRWPHLDITCRRSNSSRRHAPAPRRDRPRGC